MSSTTIGEAKPPASVAAARVPVLLLAALTAIGQFAGNLYLPGLPQLGADLPAGETALAASYAAFLLCFGAAQLVLGPWSDHAGRRPIALGGLALFLVATLACALAPDSATLVAARAVQGAGAAAAIVIGRAAARDLYEGAALARVMATITIAFALVPGLTPLAGGILADTLGWRASFGATLLAGVLLLVWVLLRLPETRPPLTDRGDHGGYLRPYMALLRHRQYMRFALPAGLAMGAMAAFFGGSPRVFIELLRVSPTEYGLYPPLAVTGFVIGGVISRRAAGRATPERLCGLGLAILAAGALLLAAPPLAGLLHKHAITAAMVVFVTGLGVLLPNAIAAAMSRAPAGAGAAAALLGFMQMSAGAAGVALAAGLQAFDAAGGFQWTMAAFTGLAAVAFGALRR